MYLFIIHSHIHTLYIFIIITYMGYGHYRDPYHDKITSVDGLITILQVCALKNHVLTMAHLSPSSPSCLKELGRRPSHLV